MRQSTGAQRGESADARRHGAGCGPRAHLGQPVLQG